MLNDEDYHTALHPLPIQAMPSAYIHYSLPVLFHIQTCP